MADDASTVFMITNNKRADIYHLDMIMQHEDTSKQLFADDIDLGHFIINEHESPIITAAFSPDGSAFATASMDGEVNFLKYHLVNRNYLVV